VEFLTACVEPLVSILKGHSTHDRRVLCARTMAHKGISIEIDLAFGEDSIISLVFHVANRRMFHLHKMLMQGPWTKNNPEHIWGAGSAPSPQMVQAIQAVLKKPCSLELDVCALTLDDRIMSRQIIEGATLQLQVPRYVHTI
jgi:hypothetical protein